MTVETIGELWLFVMMIITAVIVSVFIIWLLIIWVQRGGDREIAGLFLTILIPTLIFCILGIISMLGIDLFTALQTYFDTPLK
ncbi:unnamed protein product [marine sediment metagenome]|uniref:ABC transmembrane type-1 domain-containing protein n=1 Tax=marine sediment metagenome TaxID=412755 RepID=X1VJJ8_9ZZZZ